MFEVTAWNNGSDGYGFRIRKGDRDRYFSRKVSCINLFLPGNEDSIPINITPPFWGNCPELRSKSIRDWLCANRHAPWTKGSPPKFNLEKISDTDYRLIGL